MKIKKEIQEDEWLKEKFPDARKRKLVKRFFNNARQREKFISERLCACCTSKKPNKSTGFYKNIEGEIKPICDECLIVEKFIDKQIQEMEK